MQAKIKLFDVISNGGSHQLEWLRVIGAHVRKILKVEDIHKIIEEFLYGLQCIFVPHRKGAVTI